MKSLQTPMAAIISGAILVTFVFRPPFAFAAGKQTQKLIHMAALPANPQGFSFQAGKLLPLRAKQRFSLRIDLVWDPPTGLATNNASLNEPFQGKGGILDLGKQGGGMGKGVPKTGYKPYLKAGQIKVGHAYAVRTADGEHYGKIYVKKYDPERKIPAFTWENQRKVLNKN
jgi:hypothetical protein